MRVCVCKGGKPEKALGDLKVPLLVHLLLSYLSLRGEHDDAGMKEGNSHGLSPGCSSRVASTSPVSSVPRAFISVWPEVTFSSL